MRIQQEIDSYLRHCELHKKLSAKTIKAYTIDLKQFLSHTLVAREEKLTKPLISAYIEDLHTKYLPRSARRKLASLKAFLNYLEYEEIVDVNPIRKIKTKFKEPKTLPKTIPLRIVEKLLSEAYKEQSEANSEYSEFSTLRDIAILETLFATGVRVSELSYIRAEDVNLDEGSIRIMGKGSKERILYIGNKEVLKMLKQYQKSTASRISKSGFFFVNRVSARISDQSVRLMIHKLAGQAGITLHITPHMFRHSFATLLLEEDVDIRYIQRMLGHSSIQTTQIYTQVTAEKQRQILKIKHPRNKILRTQH